MSLGAKLRATPFLHELVLLVLLAALLVGARRVKPDFVTLEAQIDLSMWMWELALVAVPLTLIIITGGIDLSVGGTMALSGVVMGLAFQAGWGVWASVCAAMAVGLAAGALNGAFVAFLRVHPLIVTLATMSAYRGVAEGLLGDSPPVSGFGECFTVLGQGTLVGIPIPGVIFIVLGAVAAVVLWRTAVGRELYVIGHNERAARFSGVGVGRIKLALYTMSGLVASTAAVLFVARRDTAKVDIASGIELDAIAAVVLGGTSIFGGRGRIVGTVLGVLLIHEVREFVSWHWNRDELRYIVVGGLLIVSVLLGTLLLGRKES
jgi:rhamnose transport system permease protein